MGKTFNKINNIEDVITVENENDRKYLQSYIHYYNHLLKKKELSEQNGSWFNLSHIDVQSSNEYFDELLNFKIPKKDFSSVKSGDTIAQKFTKLKGYVTDIYDSYFEAKMFSENKLGTYEIGEFDIDDIDKDDLELLEEGAVFYFTFGHFINKGQVKKLYELRFQRIIPPNAIETDFMLDEANDFIKSITWE